ELGLPRFGFAYRDWNLLHNLYPKSFQRSDAAGMIGQQTDASQVEVRQYLSAQADFALGFPLALGQRRQAAIAMKRQHSLVANFVDREPLGTLVQINQRPTAFRSDHPHRTFEGCAAVTTGCSKNVAQYAMRMHTDQHGLVATQITANHGDVRLAAVHFAFVSDHAKLAFCSSDHGLTHSMHITFVLHAIAD